MEFLNNKQKIILGAISIIMLIFIGTYIMKKTETDYTELEIIEEKKVEWNNDVKEEEIEEKKIIIHIAGEVENEGIIEVDKNARIADVIEAAGGTTEEVDLSKVNLAYEVRDGQKIYIPNINDKQQEEYITEEAGQDVIEESKEIKDKVNINTAKQTELETLTGVGPSTALKIINYRQENGEFKTILTYSILIINILICFHSTHIFSFIFSNLDSPMPGTFFISSIVLNSPFSCL